MRIAFVSDVDPYDRAAFSGSTYQILQIILATGAKVEVVGPVMDKWRFKAIRLSTLPYRMMGQGVAWPKHPFLIQPCANEVDAAARRIKPDVIFSPGSNAIAYSNFLKPTIFWSDAPFAAMVDYYPWPQFQNLTPESRRYGMAADTRAVRYSAAAIYRSSWGRDVAIRDHQGDPARVHVLALPGNLFRRWSLEEIEHLVPARLNSPWKIFFSNVDNRAILCNLLQESTFFVVPSTAEALGLVFCEALSAGVPAVGRATGGVPDAVMDGRTGFLVQPGEEPAVTAKRMFAAGRDPKVYTALATTSWMEWNARFANSAVIAKLTKILERADAAGRRER
jgi:glycosyltransferase involved in cell wall biosynthesis